jgi:hypothetical protein
MTELKSRHLFTITMKLPPVLELGDTPAGNRRVFTVSGGEFFEQLTSTTGTSLYVSTAAKAGIAANPSSTRNETAFVIVPSP